MIIKGLFRRYERWNPVHPTSGAFWGMGIGFGCGIGWGPGFGPEVIGYVGAGCGVGFSVGITLAGFGVGLPANRLLKLPFSGTVLSFVFIYFWFRSGGFDPFTYDWVVFCP
ncbi:putative cadmium-induced protein AS8 [Helianthus debilis subsp. tardiflorus]